MSWSALTAAASHGSPSPAAPWDTALLLSTFPSEGPAALGNKLEHLRTAGRKLREGQAFRESLVGPSCGQMCR